MGGGIGGFGVSLKKSCAIYSELESSLKILGGIVSVGKSSSRSLCFLFVVFFHLDKKKKDKRTRLYVVLILFFCINKTSRGEN